MTPLALLMHRDIEGISPKASLREAAKQMCVRGIGSLLVGENQDWTGILSESDLVRRGVAEGIDLDQSSVDSIMSRPIIGIDIDKTAKEANDLMAEKRIRHLAVTDLGEIIGILSVRDLVICFKNRI